MSPICNHTNTRNLKQIVIYSSRSNEGNSHTNFKTVRLEVKLPLYGCSDVRMMSSLRSIIKRISIECKKFLNS